MSACQVPKPTAHHADTLYVDRYHYDSIDRWHTRHIFVQGDTIHQTDTFYADRWHIRYRDSIRTVRDSVPVPVEVVRTKTDYTGWLAFAALLALIIIAIGILRKA